MPITLSPESIIGLLTALGAGGAIALKRAGKLNITFSTGNGSSAKAAVPCNIAKSEKTGGNLHISEEALKKILEVKSELDKKLDETVHEHICGQHMAELKLAFRDDLDSFKEEVREDIDRLASGIGEKIDSMKSNITMGVINAVRDEIQGRR